MYLQILLLMLKEDPHFVLKQKMWQVFHSNPLSPQSCVTREPTTGLPRLCHRGSDRIRLLGGPEAECAGHGGAHRLSRLLSDAADVTAINILRGTVWLYCKNVHFFPRYLSVTHVMWSKHPHRSFRGDIFLV